MSIWFTTNTFKIPLRAVVIRPSGGIPKGIPPVIPNLNPNESCYTKKTKGEESPEKKGYSLEIPPPSSFGMTTEPGDSSLRETPLH